MQSTNHFSLDIGKADGSTTLPTRGYFAYDVNVGGYAPSTNVQQLGKMIHTAGGSIDFRSPLIKVGHLGYGPVGGPYPNATSEIQLLATNKLNLLCDQVDIQQDIDITRALSVNTDYGTAGQVLTSGGSGNAMSWTTPGISADTYTPGVYNPFPAGHPYASLVINAPPAGDKFTADHLRIVKDPNVAESGSLLVQGRLDIDGPSGAAGSKTALYKFSGYNHPAGALLGLGRLNVNVGNTIVLAADDLINIESQGRVRVNVGDYEGTTPVPSSGVALRIVNISVVMIKQRVYSSLGPGSWLRVQRLHLVSPLISIGSTNYGGVPSGTTNNATTRIYFLANTFTTMNAPNHYRYMEILLFTMDTSKLLVQH